MKIFCSEDKKRFIFNMYLIIFKLTDLPSSFQVEFDSDANYNYDGFTLYWSCSEETPGKYFF